jgi:phosphoribosylformylglycinamidine cyclo-ligase
LVASTDGVGTKILLADKPEHLRAVGQDLVAMCVNDIVVCGAEPLFFLDYLATGRLQVEHTYPLLEGIATGCQQAGAALLGGETAEMPGLYRNNEFDISGFCVGVVEQNQIIDGKSVQVGDCIIGLASSGPHANGFSLIRKILADKCTTLTTPLEDRTLEQWLLAPTQIYVKTILRLVKQVSLHAIAHITGGGLIENVPRVLPPNSQAVIDPTSWPHSPIFDWLKQHSKLAEIEFLRVFNGGIGMVIIVSAKEQQACLELLDALDVGAWVIGKVAYQEAPQPTVALHASE